MTQKILLVEDDTTTADFIVKGLSEQGFAVDHANNGRDGLFHATDGTYDAIVLDRMLPGMDGMAVLGAIRAAGITTPVIILSALGAVEDRVAGLTAGSDDYLTKPFHKDELVARIQAVVRRSKGHSQSVITTGKLIVNRDLGADGKFGTGDDVVLGGMATWAVVKPATASGKGSPNSRALRSRVRRSRPFTYSMAM